jgi:hypothetical protein
MTVAVSTHASSERIGKNRIERIGTKAVAQTASDVIDANVQSAYVAIDAAAAAGPG